MPDSNNKKKSKNLIKGCVIMVGGILFLIIIAISGSENGGDSGYQSETGSIGDEVILLTHDDSSDCTGSVLVSRTEEAFEDSIDAAIADDSIGQAELVMSGRVFLVPNCTKAKIIDKKFVRSEVRVMEGDHFAETGWIPYEFARLEKSVVDSE